jgi:hypothetical protein
MKKQRSLRAFWLLVFFTLFIAMAFVEASSNTQAEQKVSEFLSKDASRSSDGHTNNWAVLVST